MTTEERATADTARTVGLFALGLGVVALVSSWTGWGGLVIGLAALACAAVALWLARRVGVRRARPIAGAALGAVALVIGLVIEWDALFGPDQAEFGVGLTLDQCMAQADTAILQRACQAQHSEEFARRYPNSAE